MRNGAIKVSSISDRVLFCGNPAILDPVCQELLARGGSAAWLYDRFAFGAWLHWHPRGVRQFTCDSTSGRESRFDRSDQGMALGGGLVCRGIDLTTPILAWLKRTACERGAAQTRLIEQIERHLDAWQPEALVVDEDATPMKRIAVWAARQRGIASLVVQHGAPRVRFSFAPLAADRFLAWGKSTVDQLAGWGVQRSRMAAIGSARVAHSAPRFKSNTRSIKNILLFATTPPADSRPDAVEYHLTTRTHDDSMRMALAAVGGLKNARLTIKLHPRCRDLRRFQRLAAEFPGLHCRIMRRGSAERQVAHADVVLNCGSSAGIEAAQQGVPVIELLPAGSRDLTPAADWGQFGSAGTFEELCRLLDEALHKSSRGRSACSEVFARTGRAAAQAIVDQIFKPATSPTLAMQEAR
jgi:hypothetical protein